MDIVKKDIGGNTEAEVVLYQPDSSIHIEVLVEGETVWLTQQQIADLFGTKRPAITKHLSNIFNSGELNKDSVSSILEHTAADGKTYKTLFYNLDAILSVGYRVNSINATSFRRWASTVLKQYLLRGYAVQRQIRQLERQIDLRLTTLQSHTETQIGEVRRQLQQHQEQLDFFVRTNQPPHEGVVFEGHLLEGREVAESLIKSAKREIVLIDTYVGADTFHILEAREAGVAATIYTEKTGVNIQTLQADHEREYGVGRHIEVMKYRTSFHDRFLIVDEDVYHIGASLKDLGKRLFAFDKMGLSKDLILSQVR
ncbi:MAG: virulence RhuM family protein [Bacteroidales bacterium]|nr:virulence RhuM family protein [Bacteroidales bacterium]